MRTHYDRKKAKEIIIDGVMFILGSFIFAVSINTFTAPNDIIPSGFTGIGTMLNYLFDFPIGMSVLVLNIPLFIWGIKKAGYKFIIKTIVATIISSLMIDLTVPFLPPYSGDKLLACIFGGVLLGIGLALIFIRGATTGGTDIVASLLTLYFKHISIGKFILLIDLVIVCCAAIVYRNIESPLYAIIVIFVSTKIIDAILYGTSVGTGKMMFIISSRNTDIARKIITDIGRGVTEIKSKGVYSGKEGTVLLCASNRHQVYKIYDIIKSIDPDSFIIVSDAGEIIGKGFKINMNDINNFT